MRNLDDILADLEGIEILQTEVKNFSRMYQGSLKLEIAKDLGLSLSDVDLPYPQWATIRDQWLQSHNRAN